MNSSFNKNFSSKSRRLFLLVAMVALLAAVFTGCMKKENPESTTVATTESPLLIEPEDETTEATEATEAAAPESNITIEGKMITISGAPVEVRSAAGPDGLVIGKLEVGTQAEVLRQVEFQDGVRWALVRDGWICLDKAGMEDGPVAEPSEPEGVEVVPPATDAAQDPTTPPRPSENKPAPNHNNNTTGSVQGVIRVRSGLNVRSEPSSTGKIVGGLANGTKVTVTEQRDGWGKISNGWISMKFVDVSGTAPVTPPSNNNNNNNNVPDNTPGTKGIVTVDGLNVRSGAGTNNAAVATYNTGKRVNILEQTTVGNGTWGRTKDGWISMGYVYVDGTAGGPEGGSGVVTGNGLNVRSGPGTNYDVVGAYSAGDAVTILAQFQYGDTKWGCTDKGWISMKYVKMN